MNSDLIPDYLSDSTKAKLKSSLSDFIKSPNITNYPFSDFKTDFFLQGDIVTGVPLPYWDASLGQFQTRLNSTCIVLSNTCDMDLKNPRIIPMDCVLAPISSLDRLEKTLLAMKVSDSKVANYIKSVKECKVTNIFHIPIDENFKYSPHGHHGSYASLDKAFYIPRKALSSCTTLFSLNQFFSYLFTFQMSVHFCRFHDKVDRDENKCY